MTNLTYRDVYKSRVEFMGRTAVERAKNFGERSFAKLLIQSPHTVSCETIDGYAFQGILLTQKDTTNRKQMLLNVANDITLRVGDIVLIDDLSPTIEKWLVYSNERLVDNGYQTFFILRCNLLLKWVDGVGKIQEKWCHFTSSLDSKIKENYRTWNSLITPQVNKYAEILMPRVKIDRHTRLIVEDEGWKITEYDCSSVDGLTYLSVAEEKVNAITDDLENDIADTDKIAKYSIIIPSNTQVFTMDNDIKLVYYVTKNNIVSDEPVIFSSDNEDVVKIVENKPMAVSKGTANITVLMANDTSVKATIQVNIDDSNLFTGQVLGNDTIRLGKTSDYIFEGNDELSSSVKFKIVCENKIASIVASSTVVYDGSEWYESADGKVTVKANSNNKLGQLKLIAQYNDTQYEKDVRIVSIW